MGFLMVNTTPVRKGFRRGARRLTAAASKLATVDQAVSFMRSMGKHGNGNRVWLASGETEALEWERMAERAIAGY